MGKKFLFYSTQRQEHVPNLPKLQKVVFLFKFSFLVRSTLQKIDPNFKIGLSNWIFCVLK